MTPGNDASKNIEPGSRRSAGFLDAEAVGRHWDLGDWREWRRTPRGNTNRSYFVATDRGRFVARVSNPRKTEADMAAEVALLEYLRARDFPAPRVVATRNGGAWARVDGDLCLVTERIPGTHADPTVVAHLRGVGQALARFHAETRHLPDAARPNVRSELPVLAEGPLLLDRLERLAAEVLGPGDFGRFRRAAAELEPLFPALLEELDGESLPEVLIHGSLGRSAALFEGERLTGVLDYERVAYEARVIDLAYLLRSMTRNRADKGAFFVDRFGDLVGAYHRLEPLSESELHRIPFAMRALGLMRVRSKAANILAKHETVRQEARDVMRLVDKPMELELARIRWVTGHEDDLVAAVAA